jgi:hypothetical protein
MIKRYRNLIVGKDVTFYKIVPKRDEKGKILTFLVYLPYMVVEVNTLKEARILAARVD